ncbi:DUF1775 domain-containing protein, partial [Streptomyces graminilatus]|uniref:DUF1775 domain-containing protein n=1 Tax=Streptomyces graminilatus TaxID=1464070 RepID=UPI0006E2FC52
MFTTLTQHGTARRLTLTAATVGALVLLAAGPAAAHVEVESDKAQALAENVEISFDAEAESDTAGIAAVRVILPKGIAPGDVTYGEGPKGWKFTAADDGYTIKGPALKAGTNAEYSVVVRQLPDVKELAFKSLQTYSDGKIDRWIELDESSEQPAPVLKLKPAAPGAKPVAPSPTEPASPSPSPSSTPTPAASSPEASASPVAEAKSDGGGMSSGAWVGIGAAVVVVAGGAVYL